MFKLKIQSKRRSSISSSAGQTLVETALVLGLLLGVCSWTSSLFWTEWKRFQCAYWTFEVTHYTTHHRSNAQGEDRKTRGPSPPSWIHIQTQKTPYGYSGIGTWGHSIREEVSLPLLERAHWSFLH